MELLYYIKEFREKELAKMDKKLNNKKLREIAKQKQSRTTSQRLVA